MFTSVGKINFSKIEEGVPAFLTHSDSADVLNHARDSVGLHLARGAVSDGRPSQRHSSGDVRAGVCFDRAASA